MPIIINKLPNGTRPEAVANILKSHDGWIERRAKQYQGKVGMKQENIEGVHVFFFTQTSMILESRKKADAAREAISIVTKQFSLREKIKKLSVYCAQYPESVGYIRKAFQDKEAYMFLGDTLLPYTPSKNPNSKDIKGGESSTGAWRLVADQIYEATRGAKSKMEHARAVTACFHELGHILYQMEETSLYYDWQKLHVTPPDFFCDGTVFTNAASKVSHAAGNSENEFIAEMFSGLMQGLRYPKEAAEFYQAMGGPWR